MATLGSSPGWGTKRICNQILFSLFEYLEIDLILKVVTLLIAPSYPKIPKSLEKLSYLVKISIAFLSSTTGTIADSHTSFHPLANSITRVGSSASTITIPLPVVRS